MEMLQLRGNEKLKMIETKEHLDDHLQVFKKQLLKEGFGQTELYPAFCKYYNQNKEKYKLFKWVVLYRACEVFAGKIS